MPDKDSFVMDFICLNGNDFLDDGELDDGELNDEELDDDEFDDDEMGDCSGRGLNSYESGRDPPTISENRSR
jgi:hypothetical protein